MKTLRLKVTGLFLICVTMAFAINPNSALNKAAAKQDLLKSFKTNLMEHNYAEGLESNTTELVVVYCHVDNNSNVVVDVLRSYSEEAKETIENIMQEHPVKASRILIGETIAFKLRLKIM